MRSVRIAELRARLSEYLRAVRRGESVTVLDRDTPVARIVPLEAEGGGLVIHRAARRRRLSEVPLPPRVRRSGDIVTLLLEDRDSGR